MAARDSGPQNVREPDRLKPGLRTSEATCSGEVAERTGGGQLAGTAGSRLTSLDALRGFDMFWIMGGDLMLRSLPKIHDSAFTRGLANQMEHCEWAGFHFYDL